MKFICDEMLKGLGKWLRVAGYDVLVMPDGSPDRLLLQRAVEDGRLLLTRDRHMPVAENSADRVVFLDCQDLESCVRAVTARLDIDWLLRPFSRCGRCNSVLVEADPAQWREIPAGAREQVSLLRYCPTCAKLYWDGSHVERMRKRLHQWARRHGTRHTEGKRLP